MDTTKTKKEQEQDQALRDYPGAAVDKGDKDKTNKGEVSERTCTLNNNPRNGDMEMP